VPSGAIAGVNGSGPLPWTNDSSSGVLIHAPDLVVASCGDQGSEQRSAVEDVGALSPSSVGIHVENAGRGYVPEAANGDAATLSHVPPSASAGAGGKSNVFSLVTS
jgi:hypothetical protein